MVTKRFSRQQLWISVPSSKLNFGIKIELWTRHADVGSTRPTKETQPNPSSTACAFLERIKTRDGNEARLILKPPGPKWFHPSAVVWILAATQYERVSKSNEVSRITTTTTYVGTYFLSQANLSCWADHWKTDDPVSAAAAAVAAAALGIQLRIILWGAKQQKYFWQQKLIINSINRWFKVWRHRFETEICKRLRFRRPRSIIHCCQLLLLDQADRQTLSPLFFAPNQT